MDLRSKLNLYKSENKPVVTTVEKTGSDIQDLLEGEVVSNHQGTYFMYEERFPISWLHGGKRLSELDEDALGLLTYIWTDIQGIAPEELLFLDTETTGLSGGAGTVAFLIGLGYFENNFFILRQYFMRDYDDEPAVLWDVLEKINHSKAIVSFNGKAFDWNLLLSRFAFNRYKHIKEELLQIDLLYPARKLWKKKLGSCRLQNLEREVLSEFRVGDVPGELIPGLYFKYLDDRDATEMVGVLEHNRKDIISMVSLASIISELIGGGANDMSLGYEYIGLSKIFEASGSTEKALEYYNFCSTHEDTKIRDLAAVDATKFLKRQKEYELLRENCIKLLPEAVDSKLFLLLEMSKQCEHKLKDYESALEYATDAMNRMIRSGDVEGKNFDELTKRIRRLERKAEKG